MHFPSEPLDWNSQLHLALVSLPRTAHCQLPSASLIYTSQFHLSCASLTCTSQLHLSHLNLWMSPLMCTSQFHLWYATFTSALSCTSPWNISFAIVDCNLHLKFSFAPLGCTPQPHLFVALSICISCLQLSSSPLTGSSHLHLSVTTLIGTSRATSMCTSQFHISFEPVSCLSYLLLSSVNGTCHIQLPFDPLSCTFKLDVLFGPFIWTVRRHFFFCISRGHL